MKSGSEEWNVRMIKEKDVHEKIEWQRRTCGAAIRRCDVSSVVVREKKAHIQQKNREVRGEDNLCRAEKSTHCTAKQGKFCTAGVLGAQRCTPKLQCRARPTVQYSEE